jgi:hypothetical protein
MIPNPGLPKASNYGKGSRRVDDSTAVHTATFCTRPLRSQRPPDRRISGGWLDSRDGS